MKNRLLVPGLIALTLAGIPVIPAIAQTGVTPTVKMQKGQNKLGLTEAQKTRMKEIRERTQTQIQQLLTPEQQAQLQTQQQAGNRKRGGFKNLNLTASQQEQIKQIRAAAKQEMESILTPEQRQMMEQNRQNRPAGQFRQRRQQESAR